MVRLYALPPLSLYFGRRFSGLSATNILGTLTGYHVTAIINLWHTSDPIAREYVGDDCYIHMSMPDGKIIRPDIWEELAACGVQHLLQGKVLLVQCYGGRNRSALLAGMIYWRLHPELTAGEIIRRVRQSRPGALFNAHFESHLVYLQYSGGVY